MLTSNPDTLAVRVVVDRFSVFIQSSESLILNILPFHGACYSAILQWNYMDFVTLQKGPTVYLRVFDVLGIAYYVRNRVPSLKNN